MNYPNIHNCKAGVEQGGVPSSEEFQLIENEELKITGSSGLGLVLGQENVSSIGAADDVVLLAPTLRELQSLINLSLKISDKYFMKLVKDKTKLLIFRPKNYVSFDYWLEIQPLTIQGTTVVPSQEAEHVGVTRWSSGSNIPAI